MIELLMAASLSCADSKHIINNIKQYGMTSNNKEYVQELIDIIKDETPECFNERSK